MAAETIHANDLSETQLNALQKAATGMLKADDAKELEQMELVQITGDEVSLTEEGQATLRTLVDPAHPLL